jgi:hypothetical protein
VGVEPQRLERRARSDEARSACAADAQNGPTEHFPYEFLRGENLGRNDEDADCPETTQELAPLAIAELRVDSVEEVDIGRERPVSSEVMVRRVGLGEDRGEALDGRGAVVGRNELAMGPELVQMPFKRCASYAIRGDNASAFRLEPDIDRTCARGNLGPPPGRVNELHACRGQCEDSARLRSQPVPRRRIDDVRADDRPILAEVVVVTKRDAHRLEAP